VSEYQKAFLSPLTTYLPISNHTRDWEQDPNSLNRNAVLHGIDTKYDTLLNSCKAISILSYVSWILGVAQDASAEKAALSRQPGTDNGQ
jgi:hypothetical protein